MTNPESQRESNTKISPEDLLMRTNRAVICLTVASLVGFWRPAPAQAQADFAGTWDLAPNNVALGTDTFCVLTDGSIVVSGTGDMASTGTVTYASGTVNANGVMSLTIRASNSQTSLSTTRTYTGNLALAGTGAGNATLTDTSGTNINTTWTATRTSTSFECTGSGAVPLSLAISSLPKSVIDTPYSAALTAKGGIPPYTFAVAGLPTGLTFDVANNIISGTSPSGTAGSYPLQITLTDSVGNSTQGQLVLVVGVAETSSGSTSPFIFPCGFISPTTLFAIGMTLALMRFARHRSAKC
jgi:hypothetical protein